MLHVNELHLHTTSFLLSIDLRWRKSLVVCRRAVIMESINAKRCALLTVLCQRSLSYIIKSKVYYIMVQFHTIRSESFSSSLSFVYNLTVLRRYLKRFCF